MEKYHPEQERNFVTEKLEALRKKEREWLPNQAEKMLSDFEEGSEKVSEYLKATAEGGTVEERFEAGIPITGRMLQNIFGEGLPLKQTRYIYEGISGFLNCGGCDYYGDIPLRGPEGGTLVKEVMMEKGSLEQVRAAQELVDAYESFTNGVRAKSSLLQRVLEPLDCDWRESGSRSLTEDEVALLQKIGKNQWGMKILREYIDFVDFHFGRLFREFALMSTTPEEFESFCAVITTALRRFIEFTRPEEGKEEE